MKDKVKTIPPSSFVCTTDSRGRYEVADIVAKAEDAAPQGSRLRQNFPNPFNPSTVIPFEPDKSGHVCISVYNALGHDVRTLVNANLNRGRTDRHDRSDRGSGDFAGMRRQLNKHQKKRFP